MFDKLKTERLPGGRPLQASERLRIQTEIAIMKKMECVEGVGVCVRVGYAPARREFLIPQRSVVTTSDYL